MSPKTAYAAKLEWCNKTTACCTVPCAIISDIVVRIPVMMKSWTPPNKPQHMTLLLVKKTQMETLNTMQKWANTGSNCQEVSASASGVRG